VLAAHNPSGLERTSPNPLSLSSSSASFRSMEPHRESYTVTRTDGLSKVEPFLLPWDNQAGMALIVAQKACRKELVKYGNNPNYSLTLRALADSLEAALLETSFALSECGRYIAAHKSQLKAQLLQLQDDVECGALSIADAWNQVIWTPLVARFGALSRSDHERIRDVNLFRDMHGSIQNHRDCVVSWLQFTYLERQELMTSSDLGRVMSAAVALVEDHCMHSAEYDKAIPKYLSYVYDLLSQLHRGQISKDEVQGLFDKAFQQKEKEAVGKGMVRDARLSLKPQDKREGGSKGTVRAYVAHFEDELQGEQLRRQAFVIDGVRSQLSAGAPVVAKAAGPPALGPQEQRFHDLLKKNDHFPSAWLEKILPAIPRGLPEDVPEGAVVTVVIGGSKTPCRGLDNKCIVCGWNGTHRSGECSKLLTYLDSRSNSGGGRGGGHADDRTGGRNGSGGGRQSGGQAYQVQLAASSVAPSGIGASASVAGGGNWHVHF
jgi:hypothetical protein